MKKIELDASKLKLQKEKITDLNDLKKSKNADGVNFVVPTTTVWDYTKRPIICTV